MIDWSETVGIAGPLSHSIFKAAPRLSLALVEADATATTQLGGRAGPCRVDHDGLDEARNLLGLAARRVDLVTVAP